MKVTDCCGYPALSNGDSDTEDIGICPECGEHCEYVNNEEDYTCIELNKSTLPEDHRRVEYVNDNEDTYQGEYVICDQLFSRDNNGFDFAWHVTKWKYI